MRILPGIIVLLAGCGAPQSETSSKDALSIELPSITRLEFSTSTTIPDNRPPDVRVTVYADTARAIYAETLALSPLPEGVYNCPVDFGVVYELAFYRGDIEVVTGTLDPGGCEAVSLSSKSGGASVATDFGYWATLANHLGITEAQIYPYLPPQ
jgi:hypothetical protein